MNNWLDKLNHNIEVIKTKVSNFDELLDELKKLEYNVSYPDTVKKIYWGEENE